MLRILSKKEEGDMNEKERKMKSSQAFWNEIEKTRWKDPSRPDGLESYRAWAKRLGLDVNNLLQWERGGKVSPRLIRKVVDHQAWPYSEFYRLMALAEPDAPEYVPADRFPLYSGTVTAGEGGRIVEDPEDEVILGQDVIRAANASRNIVAVKLLPTADSMEPVVPRGSTVFVDTMQGRTIQGFRDGAVYAVITSPDLNEVTIKALIRVKGELWLVPANEKHKPVKAWTEDLDRLVVGRVIYVQSNLENGVLKELHKRVSK